jgi:hypothetical protein
MLQRNSEKRLMKNKMKWLLVVMLAGVACWVHAAGVAMVLDIRGQVTAQNAGRGVAIDIASPMDAGTRLTLAKGSEISFVIYASREQYLASGPGVVLVESQGTSVVQGAPLKTRKLPGNRVDVALGYQSRSVPAAAVMKSGLGLKPSPQLLSPLDGETLLNNRPEFSWVANAGDNFEFSLWQGDLLIYQQRLSAGKLILPNDFNMVAGDYRWHVVSTGGDGRNGSNGRFSVATAELRELLQQGKPASSASTADWVFYAMALDQAKVYTPARSVWQRVAELRPESHKLRELFP